MYLSSEFCNLLVTQHSIWEICPHKYVASVYWILIDLLIVLIFFSMVRIMKNILPYMCVCASFYVVISLSGIYTYNGNSGPKRGIYLIYKCSQYGTQCYYPNLPSDQKYESTLLQKLHFILRSVKLYSIQYKYTVIWILMSSLYIHIYINHLSLSFYNYPDYIFCEFFPWGNL